MFFKMLKVIFICNFVIFSHILLINVSCRQIETNKTETQDHDEEKEKAHAKREEEWLTICDRIQNKKMYIFDTAICPSGLYFKWPKKNFCACGYGTWQFKSDVCGKHIIIDLQPGKCFNIKEEIRWVRYIGKNRSPLSEFNFVADDNFDDIRTVSEKLTFSGYTKVGAVNPGSDLSACSKTTCYRPLKNSNSNSTSSRFRFGPIGKNEGISTVESCPLETEPVSFPFKIETGGYYSTFENPPSFHDSNSQSSDDRECCETCVPDIDHLDSSEKFKNSAGGATFLKSDDFVNMHDEKRSKNPTTQPPPLSQPQNSTISNSTLNSNSSLTQNNANNTSNNGVNVTNTQNANLPPPPFPIYDDESDDGTLIGNCNASSITCNVELKDAIKLRRRELTQKLINVHYDAILAGKIPPKLEVKEYAYLQMSRLIFEKVCPEEEVPKNLLRGLLRLFRYVLKEVLDVYPYESMGDEKERERVNGALDKCLASAADTKFNFIYPNTSCTPEKKLERVEFSWGNGTYNKTVNSTILCELGFNSSKYELSIETAWKIGTFAHYYCATHFKEIGFDHSSFEYQIRLFFNRRILTRWYFQGVSGRLMEAIFYRYDLKRYKKGIDRCVAAARSISPFKKWLKRPFFQPVQDRLVPEDQKKKVSGKSRSNQNEILSGSGYCIKNFNDFRKESDFGNRIDLSCAAKIEAPSCKKDEEKLKEEAEEVISKLIGENSP